MSNTMDAQDMLGYLRGVCLVAVVRHVGRTPNRSDFLEVLGERLGGEISQFTTVAAAFCAMELTALQSAIEELYACDDEFLSPENLNMQLGLLSGRPLPVFPFVSASGVHEVALFRPFLDASKKLIHSAVRLRMQAPPAAPSEPFWSAASKFLAQAGGGSPTAKAVAVSTIIDVASDLTFFNRDAPSRTTDAVLSGRIEHVLGELASVPSELHVHCELSS